MIKIENTETYGWEAAIRGMRNPMNSWDKSDSAFGRNLAIPFSQNNPIMLIDKYGVETNIGDNDLDLMKRLRNAGTDHRKFMRMITVYCDITAPLYWWKEFKTYRAGRKFGDDEPTIIDIIDEGYLEYDIEMNSCSTMHKIHSKEFEIDDFSHEHLINYFQDTDTSEYVNADGTYNFDDAPVITIASANDASLYCSPTGILEFQVLMLNKCRELYLKTKNKKYWWQMIQLLPSSYNQKRTVMLNYEVLSNMYKSRKGHKLDEWNKFRDWIDELPYSELITGKGYKEMLQEQIEAGKKLAQEKNND
nr:MAG TPA: hypothetical protein [Caudoviricetes sp.]